MAQRQAAADRSRAQIVAAARELLSEPKRISAFTIDAIARQAQVARMTVYYQFHSKRGLLEALFDDVARRGGIERLKDAFREADPWDALHEFVACIVQFWSSDRLIIRRLSSLAALDPEIEEGLRARDDRRRHAIGLILGRIFRDNGKTTPEELQEVTDTLHVLTSFESYDQLAVNGRSAEVVATLVWRFANRIVDRNPS
jgi:AcrR family transcriptional regulator